VKSIRSVAMLVWPALLFISAPAFAAYSCSVSSGGSINFLTYDPNTAPPTANSTITLTCNHLSGGNENISWTMTLSNGSSGTCLGPTGRTMQRQASPAATVGYNIYQNSTSVEWGNAGCGTFPGGTMSVNNGHPVESTIQTLRGVMPAGQLVPSGTYLETLVLTVTF
jgi:spore coat protein U-like protein